MTSVTDSNVYNIAVDGTFDDAQAFVKTLFGDLSFKDKYSLGAVNSINWARVLAQVVYYFYAGLKVMKETGSEKISFILSPVVFFKVLVNIVFSFWILSFFLYFRQILQKSTMQMPLFLRQIALHVVKASFTMEHLLATKQRVTELQLKCS